MNNHQPGMCIPKIQEIFPPRQLSYSCLKIIQHIQIENHMHACMPKKFTSVHVEIRFIQMNHGGRWLESSSDNDF